MDISKTKLTLIVAGSVLVGMAIVIVGAATWLFVKLQSDTPASFSFGESHKEKTVASAPALDENPEYLGSQAMYSGESSNYRDQVLAAGDARITGKALFQDAPVSGLKLRLGLNGKVMSQWGTTNAAGNYTITVPPGRYQVTGFELDRESANRVLAGKILHPQCNMLDQIQVDAASGKSASGPDFSFTNPVVVSGPVGDLPVGSKVIIAWHAYPGAASYRVQLEEHKSQSRFSGKTEFVYPWQSRPVVTTNSLDISTTEGKLKPGFYYRTSVEALDATGTVISESAPSYRSSPFHLPQS
jgi:hypothetical protein